MAPMGAEGDGSRIAVDDHDFPGLQCTTLGGSGELLGVPAPVATTAHDHDASVCQGRGGLPVVRHGDSAAQMTAAVDRQHHAGYIGRIDEKMNRLRDVERGAAAP